MVRPEFYTYAFGFSIFKVIGLILDQYYQSQNMFNQRMLIDIILIR